MENQIDLRFAKTKINTKDKTNIHRAITRDIFFHYTPGCQRTFIRKKRKKKYSQRSGQSNLSVAMIKSMVASNNILLVVLSKSCRSSNRVFTM